MHHRKATNAASALPRSSVPLSSFDRLTRYAILLLILTVFIVTALQALRLTLPLQTLSLYHPCPPRVTQLDQFRTTALQWLSFMNRSSSTGVSTRRTSCRELDAHGQTCVFDGLACVDLRSSEVMFAHHDPTYHGRRLRSDNWCKLRHQAADPRYMSSRHWPLLNDTDVPQRSCLSARYGRAAAVADLAQNAQHTTWVGRLSLVNLDYEDNTHNNHLLKDIAWLLDSSLFEGSLRGKLDPGSIGNGDSESDSDKDSDELFSPYRKILLPQTRTQFEKQTSRDVNRLTYALILRKDVRKLYPQYSADELAHAVRTNSRSVQTIPLLQAYPELESQLLFRPDIMDAAEKQWQERETVCTSRLFVGAKMGDLGHERVCRYMRGQTYEALGIQRPDIVRLGQIRYPQPPKRLLILDRHVTRRLGNAEQAVRELTERLGRHGVEVVYRTTQELGTAADFVRVYSSAGVILSPHGSHNMGLIWMQRFR